MNNLIFSTFPKWIMKVSANLFVNVKHLRNASEWFNQYIILDADTFQSAVSFNRSITLRYASLLTFILLR